MFFLFGVSLSIFLCFILLSKSGKTFADKVLTVWLFVIGLHIFIYYLIYSGFWSTYPHLLGLNVPFPLLHGPLLYIYTAALTAQLPAKKWKLLLHFISLVFILALIAPILSMSAAEKEELITGKIVEYQITEFIIDTVTNLSGVIYFVWSLLLLRKHRRNILNQFSYTDKINLRWLQYLIYGSGLIWVAVLIGNTNLIYSLGVLFVIFIGYYGIKQVGIFSYNHTLQSNTNNIVSLQPSPETQNGALLQDDFHTAVSLTASEIQVQQTEPEAKKKYKKSGLSGEEAKKIHQRLTENMERNKSFKKPEITLTELANQLNVHPNILSQVINSLEQKTFFDYINELRINEFKQIVVLEKNRKYTLLSLALECGFNSKTSFNRNFKKVTGLSPSDYLRSVNIELGDQ